MSYYERVCAEIDLGALKSNVRELKKNVNENAKFMAVVKADGYGHGATQIARAALEAGADLLGVAITQEAVSLRNDGITAPIAIIGAAFRPRISEVIDYGCQQTVFTFDMAQEVQNVAKIMRKTAEIQIKIDTGMGRLGFLPCGQSVKEVAEILDMENIKVKAIFTHLSCADHADKTYTKMQIERFDKFIADLKAYGVTPQKLPKIHISNSAAIIDHKEANYDAVRAGIALYGIYPSAEVHKDRVKLMPVMSIKSGISNVKTIKPGECVSYNAYFKAERDTKVATIPLGYADGYMRKNAKNGRVLINGQFAKIIGVVCMDQFMVDVTDIENVVIGDEAVLLGKQGDNEITVYELADNCETIPYEIVCAVSKRVPRSYV